MFQFLAITKAGCRRLFPRHLLHRITTLTFFIATIVIPQVIYTKQVSAKSSERPNIVLIMADDLGYSDLGCYGGEMATPNIDKLSKAGMSFTQFYNTGRCCPTRASLMTGLYPHNAGIGHMLSKSPNGLYSGDLSRNAITIAEGLKPAGYSTYMAGKWHLTPWSATVDENPTTNWPNARGFDEFFGTIASIRSFYSPPSIARNERSLSPPKGDFYYTEAINDFACHVIEEHDKQHPFFLYVPQVAPHWPLHARESAIEKFQKRYLAGWDELAKQRYERMVRLNLIDKSWPRRDSHPDSFQWEKIAPENREWFARRMATYAAMVEAVDDGVGQIMNTLRKRKMLDNTLIIFLSDNGGCAEEIGPLGRAKGFPLKTRTGKTIRLGNHPEIDPGPEDTYSSYGLEWAQFSNTPFRNFKSFVHEGGISTPAIFHWPGKIKSGWTSEVAHVIDVLPTCLELCHQEYPQDYRKRKIKPLDGRSIVETLTGTAHPKTQHAEKEQVRDLFWEHEGNQAVRSGNWKLVRAFGDEWHLFRIDRDRLEVRNLAGTHPEKVAELKSAYVDWAKRNGVKQWEGRQTPIGGMTKGWLTNP
jgi:arylsulfatase A-like enzyme